MAEGPVPGFEAPRAPPEKPPPGGQPKTIGYLIGAIVQLALGGLLAFQGFVAGGSQLFGGIGVLLLVLGTRAAVKYTRARAP